MASQTFDQNDQYVVPDNVQEIEIEALGAGGSTATGRESAGSPGSGGRAVGRLEVTAGETLYVRVNVRGGNATGNGNGEKGGDGGGSADVRRGGTSLSDRVIVGAGGGGGGGGNGGTISGTDGGDGRAETGEDGSDEGFSGTNGGHGGTQTAGGSGNPGDDGAFGDGGNNQNTPDASSGAGGGGWYGGEGGQASSNVGAGGGGGSNYVGSVETIANERGTSSRSYGNARVEITEFIAPGAPQSVSQSVQGDDEIDVSWEQNTSGSDPTQYRLQVSEDGGSFTTIATPTGTLYTYTASPSTNTHEFRVRAENDTGESAYSSTAVVATDPTNLSVTGVASREISLAWDGVRDATGYEVLRAESAGTTASDYTVVDTVSGSPATDAGLEDGKGYYYRVRATYPGTPSQVTNEVSDITPLPAPTLDSVTSPTEGEILIEWTLNDNFTGGGVAVQGSNDGSDYSTTDVITDLSQTSLSFTENNGFPLPDGKQFFFRVVRDTGDAQAASAGQSTISVLPRPTDLTVTDVRDDAADVRFEDGSNNKQGYRAFAGPVSTFETQRDFGAWTIQSGLQRVSDRAYEGSWSAYALEEDVISESVPRASRAYHDGGEQIEAFEYYWQETGDSYGGGIRLKNSNGDYELGVATDNPAWVIDDANGQREPAAQGTVYDKWVRFLVVFDWSAGTFSVDFESYGSDGTSYTESGIPLKQGVNVETIELWNYHDTTGWGGGALDMWWDHIATYTQNGGDLTPNEDSFETLRGWNVTHGSQVSDRVYDGSLSFFSDANDTGEQARYTIAEEGEQLSKVTYYWQETTASTGNGVRFVNSNGDYELGVTSDNPEWDVDDVNGPGQVYDPNDGYDHWVRFTVEFDWPNDQFSVDFESLASGETYSGVFDLKEGVDIERIELWNYNGTTDWGDNDLQAWWDAFEFYDASGERLQPVHYTLSGLRNGEAYVTRASVFTEDTEAFDN